MRLLKLCRDMFNCKTLTIAIGAGAIGLFNLSMARAAEGAEDNMGTGVPLHVAKRLDRPANTTSPTISMSLSGVPMRIATRLDALAQGKAQQVTPLQPSSWTGIAMVRAKRL